MNKIILFALCLLSLCSCSILTSTRTAEPWVVDCVVTQTFTLE